METDSLDCACGLMMFSLQTCSMSKERENLEQYNFFDLFSVFCMGCQQRCLIDLPGHMKAEYNDFQIQEDDS